MQQPISVGQRRAYQAARAAFCTGLAGAVLAGVASWPAAAAVPALDDCRRIADDRARLACFDAALPRLPAVAGGGPAAARPVAPAVASVMPQPAAPGTASPLAVAAPAPAQAAFGLPRVLPPETVDAISSRISGAFTGWSKGSEIRLENGQVWVVSDESVGVYRLSSPVATIRRGSFGSFFLEIEGVNQTPRVRRLR